MSEEQYDYHVTPPPSTPKRTPHELMGYREQRTIIDAAITSIVYEFSKTEPSQEIDPVAHVKWIALSEAQQLDIIKQSQAAATRSLNELPVADLPAGWKAEDMTYMLQVDASIFVRELRILPTIRDAFQQVLEILKFKRSLSNLRGLGSARDARFEAELDQARGEVKDRLISTEVWNTVKRMAKGNTESYDALLTYKRKWEEMDIFGKYDTLHEVKEQTQDACTVKFLDDPAANLQVAPDVSSDIWSFFSRKFRIVIAAYPNIHSTTSSPASAKSVVKSSDESPGRGSDLSMEFD